MPASFNFGFYYPSFAAVTIAWEPRRGPVAGGGGSSSIQNMSGITKQILFDRKTFHKIREYDPFDIYTYAFDNLDDADHNAFIAFNRVVAGAQFEVLDPINNEYFFAQLMPDSEDITWNMDIPYGERWSAVLRLFRDDVLEVS